MARTNKEFDSKKIPPVLATSKGHLNQEIKTFNLQKINQLTKTK